MSSCLRISRASLLALLALLVVVTACGESTTKPLPSTRFTTPADGEAILQAPSDTPQLTTTPTPAVLLN